MAENASDNGGREDRVDLLGYWHLLNRNRGLILSALALTIAVSWLITTLTTPIYRSAASLRIDDVRTDGLPAGGLLSTLRGDSEIATEMEVLRSRTLAEEVVDSLDLNLVVREPRTIPRQELLTGIAVSRDAVPGEYRLTAEGSGRFRLEDRRSGALIGSVAVGEPVRVPGATFTLLPGASEHDEIVLEIQSFTEAVSELRASLEVDRPNREASIVTVAYEGPDPLLVRDVANAITRHFIRQRTAIQKTEARSTVDFLREQIDTIAVQLAAAEHALQAFREGELVVSLKAEADARVDHLASFEAERDARDAERSALASLLAEIRESSANGAAGPSPYRRLIGFPTLFRNSNATHLLAALTELENQRAQILNRRTDRDPDVQVLSERIREIEEQLRSLTTAYLQGLTNHVAALDATLERIGVQLEQIPVREIQHARLQRQTHVLEQIYTLLQTRLKEAEIVQAVEDASIRIVDVALPSTKPIRPRPMLNFALAAFFGLILGIGGAFTRERLDDTVNTRDDIQSATGVTVLGLIPRIRRAHIAAGGATGHHTRLITGYDPQSPVSEAYRSLRTNITFARPVEQPRARAPQHERLLVHAAPPAERARAGQDAAAVEAPACEDREGVRVAASQPERAEGAHPVAVAGPARQPPGRALALVIDPCVRLVADRPACAQQLVEQVHVLARVPGRAGAEPLVEAADPLEPLPAHGRVPARAHPPRQRTHPVLHALLARPAGHGVRPRARRTEREDRPRDRGQIRGLRERARHRGDPPARRHAVVVGERQDRVAGCGCSGVAGGREPARFRADVGEVHAGRAPRLDLAARVVARTLVDHDDRARHDVARQDPVQAARERLRPVQRRHGYGHLLRHARPAHGHVLSKTRAGRSARTPM